MTKIQRSLDDLREDLLDQIKILQNACLEFDKGEYYQAKTIAVSLRKFCKHEGANKAILHEIGYMNEKKFLDTAMPGMGKLTQGRFYLTSMFLGDKCKAPVIPHLDSYISWFKSFDQWWNGQYIIQDLENRNFTRKKIVLYVADQDGGAHVDISLDDEYSQLSRNNSAGFGRSDEAGNWYSSSKDAIYATIRQIAYELLISLGEDGFVEGSVDWKNDNGYAMSMSGVGFS